MKAQENISRGGERNYFQLRGEIHFPKNYWRLILSKSPNYFLFFLFSFFNFPAIRQAMFFINGRFERLTLREVFIIGNNWDNNGY